MVFRIVELMKASVYAGMKLGAPFCIVTPLGFMMSEEHTVKAVFGRRSLQPGRRCEATYRQSMGEDVWRRVQKARAVAVTYRP